MSLDSVLSGQTVTVPGRHGFAVHPLPPPGSQREQDPVDRCQWEKDGGPPGFASHTPVGQVPPRTSRPDSVNSQNHGPRQELSSAAEYT